jgi:hypothetical protein
MATVKVLTWWMAALLGQAAIRHFLYGRKTRAFDFSDFPR